MQRHFSPTPALERHLERAGKLELLDEVRRISRLADIVFVRQPETLPYGNASPALAARPWLTPGEPFYYMFGDDIILSNVPVAQQMLTAYEQYKPAVVVAAQHVPDTETHLYGIIKLKPGSDREMSGIVEKPPAGHAPSNLAQVGHFVFTSELFAVLETLETGKGGELWLADAVDKLAASSSAIALPITGQWMAAGDPLRHLKASIEASLRRPDMRADLTAYLLSLADRLKE